jgi:hypothetical protein
MSPTKLIAVSSLALLGASGVGPEPPKKARVFECNMGALTPAQRARHGAVTHRLLKAATRRELPDSYVFTLDAEHVSIPDLAEWVADEARCCPAVDFEVSLPASGPLTLRLGGGADVKAFIAAELGL